VRRRCVLPCGCVQPFSPPSASAASAVIAQWLRDARFTASYRALRHMVPSGTLDVHIVVDSGSHRCVASFAVCPSPALCVARGRGLLLPSPCVMWHCVCVCVCSMLACGRVCDWPTGIASQVQSGEAAVAVLRAVADATVGEVVWRDRFSEVDSVEDTEDGADIVDASTLRPARMSAASLPEAARGPSPAATVPLSPALRSVDAPPLHAGGGLDDAAVVALSAAATGVVGVGVVGVDSRSATESGPSGRGGTDGPGDPSSASSVAAFVTPVPATAVPSSSSPTPGTGASVAAGGSTAAAQVTPLPRVDTVALPPRPVRRIPELSPVTQDMVFAFHTDIVRLRVLCIVQSLLYVCPNACLRVCACGRSHVVAPNSQRASDPVSCRGCRRARSPRMRTSV
jgi:hypothetical protein